MGVPEQAQWHVWVKQILQLLHGAYDHPCPDSSLPARFHVVVVQLRSVPVCLPFFYFPNEAFFSVMFLTVDFY